MAAAASASASGVGAKRKKVPYKGSEEEFDNNCDVLDRLYHEVELAKPGMGSSSFSSLSSSNTTATAASAAAKLKAANAAVGIVGGGDAKDSKSGGGGGGGGGAKAPVPGEGSRFLAAFRRGDGSRLVLTVTDGDNVWSATLTYREFVEHRQRLDLGDGVGWKDLFEYMKSAFQHKSRLHIELANWSAPTLHVSYRLGEHIDLLGRFALRHVTDRKHKLDDTTAILFALLERAKVNAQAEQTADELRRAKAELHTLHTRVTALGQDLAAANARNDELVAEMATLTQLGAGHLHGGGTGITGALDGDDGAGTGTGSAAAASASQAAAALGDAPAAAAILVKKKNMSVANPRIKRRKKRGVKIGEGDD